VAGRGVVLSAVEASEERIFPSLRVALARAPEIVVGDDGTVRAALVRPRRPRGVESSAEPWASLENVVFQGETKKALLALRPLRYDAATQSVVLARRLRVRLDFRGVERSEITLGGSRGRRLAPPPPPRQGIVARLVTKEEGLYRVDYEDVLGAAAGRGMRRVPAELVRVSHLGHDVPFHIEPRSSFEPGSSLYFVRTDL